MNKYIKTHILGLIISSIIPFFTIGYATPSFKATQESTKLPYTVVAEIPLYLYGPWAYIKGSVEGQEIKLLLDTGSKECIMLATRIYDTLKNVQQLGASRVCYNGLGAKFQTKRFQLDSLEIGLLSYKHVMGSIFVDFSAEFTANPEGIQKDPNYIAQKQLQRDLVVNEEDTEDYSLSKGIDYHFDGIIGRDLFEDYITILDYTQNKIILIQSNPKLDVSKQIAESEGLLETEADFTRGALYLYFNVAGEKYQFCLDTGATNSSFRYDPYLLNCLYKPEEPRVVPLMKDLKTTENGYIDIQQFDIHDCHKINCDGFLGYDFICNKKILLDFSNQKVYLKKVN